jgi:hypothetical protein
VAFCSKCGTQIDQGSAFCQNCGTPVSGANAPAAVATPAPTAAQLAAGGKTNVMAIVSLVVSIVSWLIALWGVIPLLGIILGFIANGQIKKNPGMKGRWMAILGIVLGILSLLVWIILVALRGLAVSLLG